MIGIYKITSPSGKIYIGQSINLLKRKLSYKRLDCKKQYKLYNSLVKYGFNKHIFEIIEECSLEQLNERETYWKQIELDKINNDWKQVLFCGLFDRGGGPKSEETKKKISEGLKKGNHSQYYTEELKIRLRKPKPEGFGKRISKANKGRKLSKEQINKLTINKIGKNLKPIFQYDLEGNFIQEWKGIKHINIKELNTTKNISACCKGKQKTAGGFVWKYKAEYLL